MDKEERKIKRDRRKANRVPFEESGVGKFLLGAGSTIVGTISNLLPENGALGVLKNIINADTSTSAEDKQIALAMAEAEFRDVQNARDNETARDVSEFSSFLSKNIHEIIALSVIGAWITTWFIQIRIDDTMVASAVMLILGYLYGRTKPQS